MKQGERKIGKQVFFFFFQRGRLTNRGPPPIDPSRDETIAARGSAPMKFRGYYREAPVLKYTPGIVWHLQFQRGDAGWIRWADWGINTLQVSRAVPDRPSFDAGYIIRLRAC